MVLQKHTFDNFVAKSPIELTFLVASSAINNLMQHSPIFLYGEAAVEKAYLLKAIVNKFKQIHKQPALYITARQFINDYVHSIIKNQKELFDQQHRNNALLVIDGMQFFAGKPLSQQELLIMLKEFQIQNRQIILTADRHPYDIEKLDSDLQKFCHGGLMFEIK